MKRTVFWMFCVVIAHITGQAQLQTDPKLQNVIPPSPDAQALGKFGEIPVGLFTGVPDISLPLYEIKIGDFVFPVKLGYHSAGVKVEEIASSVGLDWALEAGGTISCSVNGLNDMEPGGFPNAQYKLPNHPLNSIDFDLNQGDGGYDYQYALKVAKGEVDSQPDLFFYNFCGYSGKFYIDQSSQVHPIPFASLKFECFPGGPVRYRITDNNGVKYIFQTSENSSSVEACGTTASGSVYLSKILLPNHDSINLEYERLQYSYKMHSTMSRSQLMPGQTSIGSQLIINNLDCFGNNVPMDVLVDGVRLKRVTSSRGHVIEFVYNLGRADLPGSSALTSIQVKYKADNIKTFSLFHSYFSPKSGLSSFPEQNRLRLDSIASGDYIQRFVYNDQIELPGRLSNAQDHWGYYNGRTDNTTLLPIESEKGFTDGADREIHPEFIQAGILKKIIYPTGGYTTFDYEPNDYHFIGKEDVSATRNQFLSGSANSVTTKTFTIPVSATISNASAIFISDPLGSLGDLDDLQEGNLCTVELTGDNGYYSSWSNQNSPATGFSISPKPGNYTMKVTTNGNYDNTYLTIRYDEVSSQETDKNVLLGGLRIKRSTSYAYGNDARPIVTRYLYNDPGNDAYSSGQVNFMPKYTTGITYTETQLQMNMENQPMDVLFYYHNYWRQSSGSVFPLGCIHGGSVGYTSVQTLEGENGENGKTVSKFSFLSDGGGSEWNPLVPTISRDWKNGYLTEQAQYRLDGNAFTLIKKENNYYSDRDESEFWNQHYDSATFNKIDYLNGLGVKIVFKHPEFSFGLKHVPAEFYLNDYHFISKWVRLDSSITQLSDQVDPGLNLVSKRTYTYNNLYNLLATSVNTYDSKGDLIEDTKRYPHDVITGLPVEAELAKTALVMNWQIQPVLEETVKVNGKVQKVVRNNFKIFHDDNVLPGTIQSAVLNNVLEDKIRFNKYDINGNIIEFQKANDLKKTYLFDYLGNYPVAECVNADSSSVAYTSFETERTGNWSGIDTAGILNNDGVTGKRCYNASNFSLNKPGLSDAVSYYVSYWSQSGPYNVTGTLPGWPKTLRTVTVNGKNWTAYMHLISGVSNTSVSGSGYLDELRLFPKGTQITTYTYEPLVGMTSECDANNVITYYEYDTQGRLKNVRDYQRNINRNFQYSYAK